MSSTTANLHHLSEKQNLYRSIFTLPSSKCENLHFCAAPATMFATAPPSNTSTPQLHHSRTSQYIAFSAAELVTTMVTPRAIVRHHSRSSTSIALHHAGNGVPFAHPTCTTVSHLQQQQQPPFTQGTSDTITTAIRSRTCRNREREQTTA